MTFNNRTAVITGAAGRIGRGTAREFARQWSYPTNFSDCRRNNLIERLCTKKNPRVHRPGE